MLTDIHYILLSFDYVIVNFNNLILIFNSKFIIDESKPKHKRKNSYIPAVPSTSVVPSPIKNNNSVLKIKANRGKLATKMNKLLK